MSRIMFAGTDLENHCFPSTQGLGNPLALFPVQNNTAEIVIYGVTFVESCRVLGHDVQLFAKDTPGLTVSAMGMTGRVSIRPSLMDFGVDGKSSSIDGLIPNGDFPIFVD